MFKPYLYQQNEIGQYYEINDCFLFFGNRYFTREIMSEVFPQFQFRLLHQVHGNHIVQATAEKVEADSHFSVVTNEALVAQTADCLPVLMVGENVVGAAHAGWRGVVNRILPLTAQRLQEFGALREIAIGPHIGFSSFEVGQDVAGQILNSVQSAPASLARAHSQANKCYVNLAGVAELQLREVSPELRIHRIDSDTFQDSRYHSFRRDHALALRQYSFIARRPSSR